MKKIILFALVIVCSTFAFVKGQTIVSTSPQLKNAVLELFTGIHCMYCHDGHVVAEGVATDNPGRVVLIYVHQGDYAIPSTGEPEFRTPFGDALAAQAGVSAYPMGTVNRHQFGGTPNLAQGSGSWSGSVTSILPETSPVNIGFESSFNPTTRLLTVNVELYYTSNSNTSTNNLNVALLENHVIGYQSAAGNDYDHKHILRNLLTGQWGDVVSPTTQGSFISKTYTYTVPSAYNMDSCDIAVFVAEGRTEIQTGAIDKADNGTRNSFFTPSASDIIGNPSVASTVDVTATSLMNGTNDFTLTLTNDAPGDWNGYFSVNGSDYTSTATVSLTNSTPVDISFHITPGTTAAYATYTLSMVPAATPTAIPAICKVSVSSGVSCTSIVSTFPYSESFENDLGIWEQNTDDNCDWIRYNYATSSNYTGPDAAYNGSYYLYTEASDCYNNKTAILTSSSCFDFTALSSPQLNFWYHMFSQIYPEEMGTLEVQASSDGGINWSSAIWTLSGNQGSEWLNATVDLSSYSSKTSKLRFKGTTGSGSASDMAIDDIKISAGLPTAFPDNSNSQESKIYPNPASKIIYIELSEKMNTNCKINIYNIIGGIVPYYRKSELNPKLLKIDISSLIEGVYYLTVQANDSSMVRRFSVIR